MSTENTSGYKTFPATAAALAKNIRVKIDSSGEMLKAGVADVWVGTTVGDVAASGSGTVRLRNHPGTHLMTASAAIAAGAELWGTADGEIDDADPGSGAKIGFVALEAATTDQDIIECASAIN